MPDFILNILSIALMVVGFGFVVFFHELGHFLAAKYVGIKVEQFAVGIGHAVFCWRKGVGFCWGSSAARVAEMEKAGADMSQVGETEYRISWLPIGGYVKMLGQDDMNPNATSVDPRSYTSKPVRARMLVISAGVIMNVILAAILYMVLFLVGFRATPPVIGAVLPLSPAQAAGARVGDTIIKFDGTTIHDFPKLRLAVALAHDDKPIPFTVRGSDGQVRELEIRPQRSTDSGGLLEIGLGPSYRLTGLDPVATEAWKAANPKATLQTDIHPGDTITKVVDKPVSPQDYHVLYEAIQKAAGQPVAVTVRGADGAERTVTIRPRFVEPFGATPLNIAGMQPLARIASVEPGSTAKGQLQAGDVITSIQVDGSDRLEYPSRVEVTQRIQDAYKQDRTFTIGYLRAGVAGQTNALTAKVKTGERKRGLGVGLEVADDLTIVSTLTKPDALGTQPIERGARIISVNGHRIAPTQDSPDAGWMGVYRLLRQASGDSEIEFEIARLGRPERVTVRVPAEKIKTSLASVAFSHDQELSPLIRPRKTGNPITAAAWGVSETRDMLLQFYVTIQRLTSGSVPASNVMGPLGIFKSGADFAIRGIDWLVWFLAMISANLAVVNFLPIPITDGGQFLFLLAEKAVGRPLSPRMQTAAQFVGLAIILGLFLFVTYQDIMRLFF